MSNKKTKELKVIFADGDREIEAQNWAGARAIFKGIEKFPEDTLLREENLQLTGDIYNLMSVAYAEGVCQVIGSCYLIKATTYYCRMKNPGIKLFEDFPNRLEKDLEKMEKRIGYMDFYEYKYISFARDLLISAITDIKNKNMSSGDFNNLRYKMHRILYYLE